MVMEYSVLQGAHVVMVPFPAQGHITPFIHFAKILACYGIRITFLTPPINLSGLTSLTEDYTFEARHNIKLSSFTFPAGLEANDKDKFEDVKRFMEGDDMAMQLEELITSLIAASVAIQSPSTSQIGPPACIISDMFIGRTQDIAEKFNIPRYCLFASPAHFLSLVYHLPSFNAQGLIPIKLDAKPLMIPNFPPILPSDLPPSQHAEGVRPNSHLFLKNQSEKLWKSAGVLVNTVYELESGVIEGLQKYLKDGSKTTKVPKIMTVGPLMEGVGEGEQSLREKLQAEHQSGDYLNWLAKQPDASILYISFGSVATLPDAQVRELAVGLENSGRSFFWVLRIPKPANSEAATDISTLLPEGFLERTKERGLVYSEWAPQLQIIAHRAIGGFLTHCGWNSVIESICVGVPMIAWPFEAEQMLNATLTVKVLGIAVRIGTAGWSEIVGNQEIERAIRVLMLEEADCLRRRVMEVSNIVERAVRPGGSSKQYLQEFVEELKCLRGNTPKGYTHQNADSVSVLGRSSRDDS